MIRNIAIEKMNTFGDNHLPFFFVIDYGMNNCWVGTPDEALNTNILFNFNGIANYPVYNLNSSKVIMKKKPVQFTEYQKSFGLVMDHLKRGNSYLVNLTFPTPVETQHSLRDIFHISKAKYRLLFDDHFVVFSPETFVKIIDDKILTFPMKGTIDAGMPNASQLLLQNQKEMAEHATIVDLLRNDLSKVASNVVVDRFRYVEKIVTGEKNLLQVSSQISGDLPAGYCNNLGNILFDMLPAGSISGAPKKKTIEIIEEAENYQRGYYTGIAGYFDGKNLDSCVLIRYLENNNGKLHYKSGGGITTQSDAWEEYNELIDKIYVPIG